MLATSCCCGVLKNTSRLNNLKYHFIHDSFFQIFDNPPFFLATTQQGYDQFQRHPIYIQLISKKENLGLKIMLILDLVFEIRGTKKSVHSILRFER